MTTTVTRPNQQISVFVREDGTHFVSLSTDSSSNTFYLNQADAIDLMLSLKNALEGVKEDSYLEHLRAIKAYQDTLEA